MFKKILLGCGLPLLLIALIGVVAARMLVKPKVATERSEVVTHGDVEIKVVETGTIEPLRKIELKSKVGGRISKLFVDEDAVVTQGKPLATIDPQEINSQVAALRAQLGAAQARLAAAKKNAVYQESQTGTSIDQFVQNAAAAKARLDSAIAEAKAQPTLTTQSIEIAQANLEAAKAALKAQNDSLNLMLESTHPNTVAATQSSYIQAKAQAENSQRSVERQRKLLAKGFVSQQAVDTAAVDGEVSDAHLREVKERLDRLKQTNALEEANARSQIASAQGTVHQAQVALAQAGTTVLNATKSNELQSARAAYAQAQAQLAAARSGRMQDSMRLDEAAASAAEVQQIQQQLNERLVNQHDTTLYATMPGVITKRYVETGDLITSAIGSFSSGSPVFQISDLATMLVKLNVNEVDISKLKIGLPTEVTIDADKGAQFQGKVRKVSPAATASTDTSGNATAQGVIRFPVEIQISKANARLKPGMSARCSIIVGRRQKVLRLPTNCVTGAGDTATVQIVTSTTKGGQTTETTTSRTVKVGLRGDDYIEILSGVTDGERVRPNPYSGPPRKKINVNFGGPDDSKND